MTGATSTAAGQFVVFRVGSQVFATSVDLVEGVIEPEQIASVPGSDTVVRGVMNLRGRIIAVVELRSLFGIESNQSAEQRIIVLDIDDHTVGLLVDDVTEVVTIDETQIQPAPNEITGGLIGIDGVVHSDGDLILTIDLAQVLAGVPFSAPDA